MNILITGSNGFIGGSLLKHIKTNNIFVDDHIVLLTSNNVNNFTCIEHKNYKFTRQDFYDKGIQAVDIVIHLGAFTPKNGKEADDIIKSTSNIVNTEYLINNLPSLPKKFIFTSAIDVYGECNTKITEDTITIPKSLYGYSKLFCEKMLEIWAKNNGSTLQILRIGHIYGVGEELYRKIIPETIRKVKNDETPIIFSEGKEKRSYLNISDCCKLILNSIEKNEYYGPINIVSSNSISVSDIIDLIIKVSGKQIKPIKQINKLLQSHDSVFNNKKMHNLLGDDAISLFEGISEEYKMFDERLISKD